MLHHYPPTPTPLTYRPKIGWYVYYNAQFPTGEPVLYHLYYSATSRREAVELWRGEMRRAETKAPLGFTYSFAGCDPTGAAND